MPLGSSTCTTCRISSPSGGVSHSVKDKQKDGVESRDDFFNERPLGWPFAREEGTSWDA